MSRGHTSPQGNVVPRFHPSKAVKQAAEQKPSERAPHSAPAPYASQRQARSPPAYWGTNSSSAAPQPHLNGLACLNVFALQHLAAPWHPAPHHRLVPRLPKGYTAHLQFPGALPATALGGLRAGVGAPVL